MPKNKPKTDDVAIKVSNLSKTFILPHEKQDSLKGALMNLFLSKTYEKQQVLKNINFEIKKGDFFGIVGKNGSGKSTLLKLMAGIYAPTEGQITVNGSLIPFIELGVGFNPELSGRENVFLNGALLGFTRKQMYEMYDEIVDFAELEKFMDQKLKNYSSGMQVRLAFSIAIRANSDILLLDEVLAVGDAAFQQKCYTYFEKLKRDNQTVILVTHDMMAVQRFCTRAMLLSVGSSMEIGTPSEIADKYTTKNIQRETSKKSITNNLKLQNEVKVFLKKKAFSSDESIEIFIDYENDFEFDYYFGFSIGSLGASVAELNSIGSGPAIASSNKVAVSCDLAGFNPGIYTISAGVFRASDKKLFSSTENRVSFSIEGYDEKRGSAMKLKGDWRKR